MDLKNKIIETGKLLWDKGLAFGFNGNISYRLDDKTILITATGSCLGYLTAKDIITIDLEGNVIGEGKASTERLMHTSIYKSLPKVACVVHTHSTYTTGYFINNDVMTPKTFEAQFYLGQVKAIPQTTPSVTDTTPVIEALKANNIVVLKNHGVVAVGDDLFHAFVLIQELEEQAKVELVSVHYARNVIARSEATKQSQSSLQEGKPNEGSLAKKYKLFSKEQIDAIVEVVNSDPQMQELGNKTAMNMSLAVILDETQQAHRFTFENGRIKEAAQDANAEFVINAPENIWRAVFNREIDPFVATTQKKMTLKGDFAKISKWYAPCSRIFQLWTKVNIE